MICSVSYLRSTCPNHSCPLLLNNLPIESDVPLGSHPLLTAPYVSLLNRAAFHLLLTLTTFHSRKASSAEPMLCRSGFAHSLVLSCCTSLQSNLSISTKSLPLYTPLLFWHFLFFKRQYCCMLVICLLITSSSSPDP